MFSEKTWELLNSGSVSSDQVSQLGVDEVTQILNEFLGFLELKEDDPDVSAMGSVLVDFYAKLVTIPGYTSKAPPKSKDLLEKFLGGSLTVEKILFLQIILRRYFAINEILAINFAIDKEKTEAFGGLIKEILIHYKDHPAISSVAVSFSLLMDLVDESLSLLEEIYKYPELMSAMLPTKPPSSLRKDVH